MVGFLFGGDTGISSPQELEQRRQMAALLMRGKGRAENVGQGVGDMLTGIALGIQGHRDRKAASAGQEGARSAIANLLSGGQGAFPPAPAAPSSSFATAPEANSAYAGGSGPASGSFRAAQDDVGLPSTAGALDPISQRVADAHSVAAMPGEGTPKTAADAAGVSQTTAAKNPMDLAATLIGKGEVPDRSTIQEYLANGGVNLDPATTAWCAAYVNSSLAQAGIQGTGSNAARSFLNFGQAVDQPQKGDIAVFSRGNPNGWQGHVGFYDSMNPDGTIRILAGNQGDAVDYGNMDPSRLLGYRRAPSGSPTAPTQPPVQLAQAGGMPEMAGNAPPVQPQQSGPSMQQLLEAAQNPWLSDSQRGIVNLLLKQQMEANDPNASLDAEYKRAQIDNMRSQIDERLNPSARDQFGLSPIYGKDANGNLVVMQPSKSGGLVKADLPEGVTLQPGVEKIDLGTQWGIMDRSGQVIQVVPKDVAGEAAATAGGKAQGEAAAALGQAEAGFDAVMQQIEALRSHPGLESSVGTLQGRVPDAVAGTLNADVADFRARLKQTQGQAFLRAFESLKGGGAITEIEGLKAEQAIARLNQAVSEDDFRTALDDLQGILSRGIEAYRRKAGQSAPAAPAQAGKRLRFNPQTGELE